MIIRGHAFVQDLRRGHYELGVDARHDQLRIAADSTNWRPPSDRGLRTQLLHAPRSTNATVPVQPVIGSASALNLHPLDELLGSSRGVHSIELPDPQAQWFTFEAAHAAHGRTCDKRRRPPQLKLGSPAARCHGSAFDRIDIDRLRTRGNLTPRLGRMGERRRHDSAQRR